MTAIAKNPNLLLYLSATCTNIEDLYLGHWCTSFQVFTYLISYHAQKLTQD